MVKFIFYLPVQVYNNELLFIQVGQQQTSQLQVRFQMQESIQHNLLPSFSTPSKDNQEQFKEGRWTKEEHNRFLEAIDIYGSDWVKMASFVGTRNVAQVRSHAQKYFNKKKSDEQKIGHRPIDEHFNEEKVQTRSKRQCKLDNSSTISLPQKIQQQKPQDQREQQYNQMQDILEKQNKSKNIILSKMKRQNQSSLNLNLQNENKNIRFKINESKQVENQGQILLKTPKNKKKRRQNCAVTIKKPCSLNNNDWKFNNFIVPKCISYSETSIPIINNLSDFQITKNDVQIYKRHIFEPSMMINQQIFSLQPQNKLRRDNNLEYFIEKDKIFQYYAAKDIIPIVIINKYRRGLQINTNCSLFQ